jgi:hypothetical protein
VLEQLRRELEGFKVLARLCHELQGFGGTRVYLYVAERRWWASRSRTRAWLRQATRSRGGPDRDDRSGEGVARTGRAEPTVRASPFHHCASDPPARAAGMSMQVSYPTSWDRPPMVSVSGRTGAGKRERILRAFAAVPSREGAIAGSSERLTRAPAMSRRRGAAS